MDLNLPSDIASSQDIKSLIADIRKYANWYAQASVKAKLSAGKQSKPPALSEASVGLIESWAKAQKVSQASLGELISSLVDFEESAPHITITLAAPAPGTLKNKLIAWCRQNIAPNVLVDIRFNSTLLGGMVVRYGSHVYDWSFRRQILASRDKFPEVLRRV